MPASRPCAREAASVMSEASTVLLICLLISIAQAHTAFAQTASTCPNGQVLYPTAGQTCTTAGTCAAGYVWNGATCVGNGVGNCPTGSTWNGVACVGTGAPGCAAGDIWNGATCVASSGSAANESGSCAGIQLQFGQSCANGVLTCNGQPLIPGAPCATVLPPAAEHMTCPGGGFVPVGQACPSPSGAPTSMQPPAAETATTASGPPATGFAVSYPGGWNIVAGPSGTTLSGLSGSLFTLQPGDTSYEVIPSDTPLKAGAGYWVDLPSALSTAIATRSPTSVTVPLPAGQSVMIGNPGSSIATVTGADSVLVYNPTTATYAQTNQLQPGQGAWAVSNSGGQAIITNVPA